MTGSTDGLYAYFRLPAPPPPKPVDRAGLRRLGLVALIFGALDLDPELILASLLAFWTADYAPAQPA